MRSALFASASIPAEVLPPTQVQTPGTWHRYWITNIGGGDVDLLFSEYHPPNLPAGWRRMAPGEVRAYLAGLSQNEG